MTPLEAMAAPPAACDPLCLWLWMAYVLGPACQHAGRFLQAFGGAEGFYRAVVQSDVSPHLSEQELVRLGEACPADFAGVLAVCRQKEIALLTPESAGYPPRLLELPDLPLALFVTGDVRALQLPNTVGMVGSRRPTPYGLEAAEQVGGVLAAGGVTIVSGMAEGLDSAGHRAALAGGKKTIAVAGVPIDKTYPANNLALRREIERNGCVVSEYGPGGTNFAPQFLQRNRLIAGLSDALLVVEARERSGTMNTVGHAARYGRPVYAVPGSIFNAGSGGTNALLASGQAKAAPTGHELLEALGLEQPPRPGRARRAQQPEAPECREPLLDILTSRPMSLSALAEKSGKPITELLPLLMRLELEGRVEGLPGGMYRRH